MNSSSDFKKLYDRLNSAQRQAVDTIEGPVVVQAGPGTGKTQILSLRIANILEKQGGDMAENILALTFTHAGVRAMRERLGTIIGSRAYEVGIFTFHSFAEYLINRYHDTFGEFLELRLASDVERLQIIEGIVLGKDYTLLQPFSAPRFFTRSVLAAIDELKRDAISAEAFSSWNELHKHTLLESEDSYYKRSGKGYEKGDMKKDALRSYEKNLELAKAYEAYELALQQAGYYDYNDLILTLLEKLEHDQEFLYELQEKYQYILLDEHQDSNGGQNKIVELLTKAEHLDGRANIFTVGDDKQAIYRFQGASIENFTTFGEKYSEVEAISLQDNYRSSQDILDAAHYLINHDENKREHVRLTSHRSPGEISCHNFPTYHDELDFVSQEIRELNTRGVVYHDIAILYRENRHTQDIQKALGRREVPSVVLAKSNVLESPINRKIIMLLESINDITNNRALSELLYSGVFNTQTYDVLRIIERTNRGGKDASTGSKDICKILQDKKILKEIGVEEVQVYVDIVATLHLAHMSFISSSFMSAFDELVQQTGVVHAILEHPNSEEALRSYARLYQEFSELAQRDRDLDLSRVVTHLATLQEYDIALESSPSEKQSGVRLLTAHKSKGLEYKHVFIVNVVDKVWGNKTNRRNFVLPTGASRGDNSDERRLLYVAITRAKESCTISYSHADGEKATVASPLMYELPQDLVQETSHESRPLEKVHAHYDPLVNSQSIFSDEFIVNTFLARPLSVTALNNYLHCPARYFVNNLLRIPASYSRSLVYGSLVHRALELFFTKSKADKAIASQDFLLDTFRDLLEKSNLRDKEQEAVLAQGIASLSGYYENKHATWTHSIDNELRINALPLTWGEQGVLLSGVLDKIEYEKASNRIRVVDYKTGKTFSEKSKEQKEALRRQIVFYDLLVSLYQEGRYEMSSGVLDFVEPHKKTGQYEEHEMCVNEEDRKIIITEIQNMYDDISRGQVFLEGRCKKRNCKECRVLSSLG